ncbi:MAG TPA: SDR family oxidoreductase [Chloroflexota bacterium]|nr:SDR family oxidoreductase [Chloroflexota bacterium]
MAPAQEADEHPMIQPGRGRLTGKTALVTGADSGIGRATARVFAREGAKVVCMDIWETGAPRVDRLIHSDGGDAIFVQGDVTNREDWQRAVATALDRYGGLDVLHSNAGGAARGKIHEISDEAWDRIVQLNLYGLYYGARAVLPHFLRAGRGNVVFTASTQGILARAENAAYCATKAAIVNLTREMAIDYGPTVRVNCVCPGPIDTPRWRGWPPQPNPMDDAAREDAASAVRALHRLGRPEEVAYAVLFLASDESSYVTGHSLVIDGGQTIDVR